MSDWFNVKKKPIVVQARPATAEDEEMIRRREGEAVAALGMGESEFVWPLYHIMQGPSGEEYPIATATLDATYDRVPAWFC